MLNYIKYLPGFICLSSLAFADVPVKPAPIQSNPFQDGVKKIELTPEERTNLLQYADNSEAKLQRALQDAEGLDKEEKLPIYWNAIQSVVIESYQNKTRSELLLRYALNQAMDLTYGVPDGKGSYSMGALQGAANPGVHLLILESSMRMAIRYYKDDRWAIEKGALLVLPYADFAQEHLSMGINWLGLVLEYGYQYRFSMTILKHWFNTIANEDSMIQTLFAEEIIEVDALLKNEANVLAGFSKEKDSKRKQLLLVQEVRHLRGVLDRLKKSADKKNEQLKKMTEEKKK